MSSLRALTGLAIGAGLLSFAAAGPKSCSVSDSTPLSCKNTTAVADTCCFNAPGGLLLQTQFWDSNPPTGPEDSWTIHGLWPDNCDGTYEANCDASREYTNISAIIGAGDPDTLSYMKTYWKDYQGNDESFWEHEWGKHGTCISTLETKCYSSYSAQEEVVDYFQKTVELFKTLPTYKWLSDAGITPSTSKTYTSSAILAALKKNRGVDVSIMCKNGEYDETWYFYNTQGSVQTGKFVAANPDGSKSNCPATGIKYLPKSGGGGGGTTTTKPTSGPTTTPPSPTGTPWAGKGALAVTDNGAVKGGLISTGKWMVGATLGSITAASSGSGFTLTSSKGPCAVVSGAFSCASGNNAEVFTQVGGLLATNGQAKFYADATPSGTTQVTVKTASSAKAITIVWAQ